MEVLLANEHDAMQKWVGRRLEMDAAEAVEAWMLQPFDGLGPLRFGMPRDTVRELLGAGYESPYALNDVDDFPALGLRLYYDLARRLVYVEAAPPCHPVYGGVPLLQGELADAVRALTWSGHETTCDEDGCDFPELGFHLFAPSRKENEQRQIASVGIYPRPARHPNG